MPRFFVDKDSILSDKIVIGGEDAKHISLSLRARVGEKVTACDGDGIDYECEISDITKNEVVLSVTEKNISQTEPSVCVTLYQSLVKSDKFDFIVQKCTELGVLRIVPVVTERCISRPDEASLSKKVMRWNKIAKEAAMQSGRGRIPVVEDAVEFDEAVRRISTSDFGFLCYEAQPHEPLDKLYEKCTDVKNAAFLVGPEGGISEKEVSFAKDAGLHIASLGPRILRAETAPLCVMSAIMLLTGNMS